MDEICPEHILKLYSEAVQMPVRCYLPGRTVLYCPLSESLPKEDFEDPQLLRKFPREESPWIWVNRCGEIYGALRVDRVGETSEIYITGPGRLRHIGEAEFRQLYQKEGFIRLALERKMVFNGKMERVTIGRMKILLGMLYYMRTGRLLDLETVQEEMHFRGTKTTDSATPVPVSEGYYNTSGAYERELSEIVSHGEIERLRAFFQGREHVSFGNLSEESMRHQKNLGIVTVTIVSRAAIRGGMNEEYAYYLSDAWIRDMEAVGAPEELNAMIGNMIREYTKEVQQIRKQSLSPPIRDAEGYISQYYAGRITVASIARDLGYSPNYLGSLFKKETGMSICDAIMRKRVERAAYLLRTTNMTVTEISAVTGFSAASHLCRVFKEEYGKTPAEYRKAELF